MSKPHLILVPGLLCDRAVWEHQIQQLRAAADITIADHGVLDSLVKMAMPILDRAPERFALAGHSMGGRVAMEVYRSAPERVTRLALLDTAYAPFPTAKQGTQERQQRYALLAKAHHEGMRTMGAEWAQNMVHPSRLSDHELMNAILDMIQRKTPDIFASQIKALLERPDASPVLPTIRCPTLVLCGRQDAWSGLAEHERMARMIPNSRLAIIEHCGHMSTMERPIEVTAAMQEWLTF
jgi:pimeloyl-ACP methyl ester carboxylesterase